MALFLQKKTLKSFEQVNFILYLKKKIDNILKYLVK